MTALRRRLRGDRDAHLGPDAGVSLIEMLISMAMASILMLAIGTLFVSATRQNRTVIGKTTSTADARIGMEAITRELRVAIVPTGLSSAITAASASSVTFYASIGASTATTDPGKTQIVLTVDTTAKCLKRSVTSGTVTTVAGVATWTPSGSTATGCVARGNFSTSLFTYYPLAADDTISTTAYTTAQLPSNLGNIAAVGLNVSVTDTAAPSVPPSVLQDQVTLINVATALAG